MTYYSIEQEYEDKIILEFQNACLNNEFNSVIQFIRNEQFRKIIVNEKNIESLNTILKITYQNNGKEFIKNLIFNEVLIKNEVDILFLKNLFKIIEEDKQNTDLIDELFNDERIIKTIKNAFIKLEKKDEKEKLYYDVFSFACKNGYVDIVKKLLNNEEIRKILINDNNKKITIVGSGFYFAYDIVLNNCENENKNYSDIIEIILNDKDILEKVDSETISRFILNIPNTQYENRIIELFDNEKVVEKITTIELKFCFNNCYRDNKIDIIKKIFNNEELLKKFDSKYMVQCFINAYETKKSEIVDLFFNNEYIKNNNIFEEILIEAFEKNKANVIDFFKNNEYLKNKDIFIKTLIHFCEKDRIKIVEEIINNNKIPENVVDTCFYIAFTKKNDNIIKYLLNNPKTKNTLNNKVVRMCFFETYRNNDTEITEEFIISKPDILTKEIINELNKDKTSLLYNILNNDNFNEKDIKVAKILIDKGLKINKTSEIVRKNINKLIKYLDNEGKNLKKQYFGVINEKKLEKTEEAIEKIRIFINMEKSTNDIGKNLIGNSKIVID